MAKLTLTDGTIFEGTTEEIFAITERFNGVKADDPIAGGLTHNGVEYTLVDRKAQEGDVVVFTDKATTSSVISVNKPYTVFSHGIFPKTFGDDGERINVYRDDEFNRTTETVLVYAPKVEALKVGDYAKVVGLTGASARHNGEIVELTKRWDMNSARFNVSSIGESGIASCNEENLRKATDEEVAEAKVKAEAESEQARKEAVFTQAGRNPNEYRKGDIVTGDGVHRGESVTGEVEDVGNDLLGVVDAKGYTAIRNFQPIVFVENRLDK